MASNSAPSSSSPPPPPLPPPVVIVGGGPVGLFLSHLLRHLFGIPHVLLEQQRIDDCFRHPQAHFLNTRTMELFRHCLSPTVSSQIVQAMPPVHQWQNFSFGSGMDDNTPLAVVRHPVHRPLQVAADANGVLLSDHHHLASQQQQLQPQQHNPLSMMPSWSDLSPCSVGHLAQHTLGRILYDSAISDGNQQKHETISKIRYGTRVERIHVPWYGSNTPTNNTTTTDNNNNNNSSKNNTSLIQITTADGTVYETDWLVAADGAHSTVRSQLQLQFAEKDGRPDPLQHLMNMHVTLPPHIAAETLHNNNNHAMLYSVYSEHVVAMVVCHSVGEYIVQIPFFPPYQTPESDFGPDQWPTLLHAIFGPRAAPHCHIVSVRPWIMTSWVARRYGWVNRSNNENAAAVVLVGDAAHVFPPAGGFGLNTGLQDAHNLACKIATQRFRARPNDSSHNNNNTDHGVSWHSHVVSAYEQERQPIARQNAALSLRNYQRLLRVTQQLYLNDRHPALLQSVLDRSAWMVPLAVRQATFRSLLQTALYPLRWLKHNNTNTNNEPSNFYRNHIQSNLNRILESGAGLPLLFPKYEIGYTYDCMLPTHEQQKPPQQFPDRPDGNADTWAAPPQLCVGGLVPHVAVVVPGAAPLLLFPQLRPLPNNTTTTTMWISTTNLPAQMARSRAPCYVLLWVVGASNNNNNDNGTDSGAKDLAAAVSLARERAQGLPVEVAVLWPQLSSDDSVESYNSAFTPTLVLPYSTAALSEVLHLAEPPRPEPAFSWARWRPGQSYGVFIRPDGHIQELLMG